jgi:hypothetical protein
LKSVLPKSSILLWFFFVGKELNAKDIPVYEWKCLSRKAVHPWWQIFADDEEVEMEVRKWLRQQSKDNCDAGFDALVKRWDKCISVSGGCVEK